jgi:hypothetical protein
MGSEGDANVGRPLSCGTRLRAMSFENGVSPALSGLNEF